MIQSQIGHAVFNINPTNAEFYKDLMTFMGWRVIFEQPGSVGVSGKNSASLWFMGLANNASNDYDGPGMNHLGLSVPAQADVDTAVQYLTAHNVKALFETPRHRPDFTSSPDQTYYQVMFESPDRILFEIVYIGPKSA